MRPKHYFTIGMVVVIAIIVISLFTGFVGVNDGQNWVYLQHLNGKVKIINDPGMYMKAFGKTWTYPRYYDFRYNADPDDGDKAVETIKVTYNDSGEADISTYIRLRTPVEDQDRISFHQQIAGKRDNVKAAVKSFMIDCLKSTAPLMSSSENQSARKAEFRQTVEGQLRDGSYKMSREKVFAKDAIDRIGERVTIYKTRIVVDKNGMPITVQASPIVAKLKMTIEQFSVTGTDYEPDIRKQFALKKEAFLLTEKAKADREKEVQTRLMIIEKGLKEKAEATATGNVAKEIAVIAAMMKAEVALQTKIQAETKAAQLLSVAELDKKTLLMGASAKYEQSQIQAKTAQELKKAMIAKAQGRKEAIELSGDITQIEQAQIRAEVDKAKAVAEAMAKMVGPEVVIFGGGEGGGNITEALFQLRLMQDAGLIKKVNVDTTRVERKIVR